MSAGIVHAASVMDVESGAFRYLPTCDACGQLGPRYLTVESAQRVADMHNRVARDVDVSRLDGYGYRVTVNSDSGWQVWASDWFPTSAIPRYVAGKVADILCGEDRADVAVTLAHMVDAAYQSRFWVVTQ